MPTYITSSGSTVDINTTDRSYLGEREFTIIAVISNGEKLHSHNFEVSFIDSCEWTSLTESEAIDEITLTALQEEVVTISYETFTNTIAEKYGVPEACGPTLYAI